MKKKDKELMQILRLVKTNTMADNLFEGINLDDIEDSSLVEAKTPAPSSKNKYVGVEIECFSECDVNDLFLAFYEARLENKVDIGDDASIDEDYGRGYEIRVMDTEKNIGRTIKKVFRILKKLNFGVNRSCGLHVHLDCRNRDKDKLFARLIKAQILLFGLVDETRIDNTFCRWTREHHRDKYRAINFTRGKTIEVRLHQSTLDAGQVVNWINLLLKLANHKKNSGWFRTPKGVKKQIKLPPTLSKYLKDNYVARTRGVDYDTGWESL